MAEAINPYTRARETLRNLRSKAGLCAQHRNNNIMSKRKSKPISDQLRQAIQESDLTRYRIAQETGIDESALAKFFNGKRGLSLEAIDRLGELLKLRVVSDRTKEK